MSREEALKIAREGASAKIKASGLLQGIFGRHVRLSDPPVAESLLIVRPNNFLSRDVISVTQDINVRLAWLFWFRWDGGGETHGMAIFVDAEIGKCIAGDAF
ncbi:MAG: hypothetical protein M3463_10005 [Verrucomicrobiota bacterium]|nr:hypothetical protein [Verrucomicrobiota bacterium]